MESALREGGREPGLRLIETLAWDGAQLVRGDRHLARLARSAALLGWPCDASAARKALLADRAGPERLRLTLDASGQIEVTSGPILSAPGPWHLSFGHVRLRSDDPWLRLKTTRRQVYFAARAAMPEGIHEVLFLNERGEVCEGTITNVFFDAGDGLCTPPLACGLLPGILREEMLATGQARECVLPLGQLADCKLFVGNSLRGLIPAVQPMALPR
ncbi:aminotransferase class IV family protein [Allitabrizicola rongguiensis]|uniref:aminotransferase class IV family protein n=1 Tax=Alitabrizicola rongguiensis TaxID=2909234 RepID=UPI003873434A